MDSEEKKRAIQGARVLEKHGRFDSAVQILKEAGAFEEAVRVLSGQRRFAEAATLLVDALGAPVDEAFALSAEKKKWALLAAICYSRAGQTNEAVQLFIALREHQRAAEVLQKAGDTVGAARVLAAAGKKFVEATNPVERPRGVGGAAVTLESAQRLEALGKLDLAVQAYVQLKRYGDAGRIALRMGKPGDAASFFAEAGLVYEAGASYVKAGDSGKALENFVRVPRDDPRYRPSCLEVVRLAADLNYVGLKMDHFLARFIEEGPTEAREFEAFYLLSKLYEKHDLLENAKETFRKLLAVNPRYRDAAAQLAKLENETSATPADYARILKEERSYYAADARHGKLADRPLAAAPELPSLPPLPSTNSQPARATPVAAAGSMEPVNTTAPVSAIGSMRRSEELLLREVGEEVERIPRELNPSAGPAQQSTGNTLFAVAPPTPVRPATGVPTGVIPPPIGVGTVLADRYILQEEIGRGGMAMVFRAADQELDEQIAVKIFTQGLDDEQALKRFRQELQLTRQLVHPNIIRVFDIGLYHGRRFITMELLVGSDLKSRLGAPLLTREGIDLLIQACHGLQAAHDRGIIHRDVKPENLFITREGVVKVMDFGIAKGQIGKGVTVAGMVAGTPDYISPEQINNFTAVTGATDLYSLGIVAYEMFTGQLPFQHAEQVPLLMMHLSELPPPPRSVNPSVPEPLERIILKLLEKQPEKRFPSCNALAQALEKVRNSC